MRQWLMMMALWVCALSASGQDEPEYRLELGAGAGLAAYEGDLNGSILRSMQPMGTLVAKYKMNPRMAWTALLGYGQLKGSSANVETWYPQLSENPITFSTRLIDLSLRYEYNFWPFGTGREYLGARPLTPFLAVGVGLTWAKCDKQQVAPQLPLGVGVKYKIADRLNLAAEWMMHLTTTDELDGQKDPYGIKSSGLFKNTDCYSVLLLTLTYDLWAKCKTCHKE